jgi:hypothetical protein
MMRALCGGCTAGGERREATLVRAQTPAAGRRLVYRSSNQRVPEAEASGHLGLANEVDPQQLVQSLEHRRLGDRSGSGRKLGLERVSGYGCPLQHQACAVRQENELLRQRRGNRGRHVEIRGPELGNVCRALESERSSELLEIERVAAAFLVETCCCLVVDRVTKELSSFSERQSADLDAEK